MHAIFEFAFTISLLLQQTLMLYLLLNVIIVEDAKTFDAIAI